MTTVNTNNTTATSTTSSTSSLAAASQIDYNSFLKLLMEQMKNQDPTSPVDQTQMLAQLAQFSNVGQTAALNDKLNTLITNQQATTGAALVGKTVTDTVNNVTGVVKSVTINASGTSVVMTNGYSFDPSKGINITST
jgi:flagellar basal-body rod modification protein FlgD